MPSSRYVSTGKTGKGSGGTTGTAVTLSTTSWTQCQVTTPITNATRVYFAAPQCQLKGSSTASGCYFDDFVVYYDSTSATDTIAPATGPSNVGYDGGILSWTNGSDDGTGVQGSIILATNASSPSVPVIGTDILHQGYYRTGETVTVGTTVWTILADTSTTSLSASEYTSFVVINHDKAYNYSSIGAFPFALPVALKSFNGSLINSYASLSWATAAEINTNYFTIETSSDGKNFISIGEVVAKNQASNYSFTDQAKIDGLQYYRLKIVNADGSYSYSSTISLSNKVSLKLSVYPNPVYRTATVSHQQASVGALLKITSIDGKLIATYPVQTGATATSIDASRLVKGSYIVSFTNNGTRTTTQFVK